MEDQTYLLFLKRTLQDIPAHTFLQIMPESGASGLLSFGHALRIMTEIALAVRSKPRMSIDGILAHLKAGESNNCG